MLPRWDHAQLNQPLFMNVQYRGNVWGLWLGNGRPLRTGVIPC